MIDKLLNKINKYYIFVNYTKKQKISLISSHNNKKEIFSILKNKIKEKIKKENYSDISIILLKIIKVNYNPNQPIKMVFGPVKVEIKFFELSERGSIKKNNFEKRNNHLFYTNEYLENNKIIRKDLKKIVNLAVNNKLEKRLLAPKTIDQIL